LALKTSGFCDVGVNKIWITHRLMSRSDMPDGKDE
jgi:hypothetical protein